LTNLRWLRADCGGGRFASCHGSEVGTEQAKGWAVALQGMQQLTRLEMTRALVCDPLLRAIGSAGLPLLQTLVLEALDMSEDVFSTADGADAVAHVPCINLELRKGMMCKQHLALFQLPNIKRVARGTTYLPPTKMKRWTPARCVCVSCAFQRREY
jgi:hypothetical protein